MEKEVKGIPKSYFESMLTIFLKINDTLLKKVNNKSNDITFLDHYYFQTTSYFISIIHNKLTCNVDSYINLFSYRCLIESLAVMLMYDSGDIKGDSTELINQYDKILEYNIYKKYKNIFDGKQFFFSEIEKSFHDAKKIYRDALDDINTSEFRSFINRSKMPFLLENYSFDSIVKKYYSDLYQYYRILSLMIHPHDISITYSLLDTIEYDYILGRLIIDFINIYEKNSLVITSDKYFEEEWRIVMSNEINQAYLLMAINQKEALEKVSKLIKQKYDENIQSCMFSELGNAIESIAIDKTFGFSEIVKCKYKCIVELLALNYLFLSDSHHISDKYKYTLFRNYSVIKYFEILGEDCIDLWKDSYEIYCQHVDKISFEDFKEIFSKSLGYIPEKTSINKLVYNFIDKVYESDNNLKEHMKMVYDEAQALSHANGYMLTSNTGAFSEQNSVIPFVDNCVVFMLDLYIKTIILYNETEGEKKYNKFIYDLKKNYKVFCKNAELKNKLDFSLEKYKVQY